SSPSPCGPGFCCPLVFPLCRYRALTFILTFLLYTIFHLSRKPINCSSVGEVSTASSVSSPPSPLCTQDMDCSWKPFAPCCVLLFSSGIIGERLPIRLYLTVGMLTSGLFTCLFGLGYVYNVHSLGFYVFVQVQNGLVQTTGWPSVVTCIGNWFGKGSWEHSGFADRRYWVSSNWGLSFIVPGLIIANDCLLFQVASKSWSGVNGHAEMYLQYKDDKSQSYDTELLLPRDSVRVPVQPVVVVKSESEPSAISFMGALRIPVKPSFCGCPGVTVCRIDVAKIYHVSWIFLFSAHLDAKKAGDLSTLFDVGGIVGGILAGVVSDKLGKRATTCAVMLLLAAPTVSLHDFWMLLVCGGLVNGPYALITTAVSADLGTHKSLKGNARALSTVTAIIDGTGSVGAALGPLLAGLLSAGGWDQVFYMLMTADFFALLVRVRKTQVLVLVCRSKTCS
uniref:Solute carrier family 37 member 1 n=1 Tax=Sphaeramia orbicularis TaxID=375764 RepID=A0A672ZF63_9TELE